MREVRGDLRSVKDALTRMEILLTKLDVTAGTLATKGSVDAMSEKVAGLDKRLGLAESSITSKVPSWWQMPAAIGATVTLLALLYAGAKQAGVLP